jgi:hypothetical protein
VQYRTGQGPGDAGHGLHLGDDELAEAVYSLSLGPDDDVIGPVTTSAKRTPGIVPTASATPADLPTSVWMST